MLRALHGLVRRGCYLSIFAEALRAPMTRFVRAVALAQRLAVAHNKGTWAALVMFDLTLRNGPFVPDVLTRIPTEAFSLAGLAFQ